MEPERDFQSFIVRASLPHQANLLVLPKVDEYISEERILWFRSCTCLDAQNPSFYFTTATSVFMENFGRGKIKRYELGEKSAFCAIKVILKISERKQLKGLIFN